MTEGAGPRTHPWPTRRSVLRDAARLVGACATWPLAARAAATGSDPLRILCSGPAGSIPDLIARAVAEQLPATLGRRALVDNRPGAAGRISVSALKAAPADGSTLLLAQGAIATVYPHLYARLGYDPDADLRPVCLASEMPIGLAVGPSVPAEVVSLAGFIAWLRSHPSQANFGSPGTGTLPHLVEAMLMRETGLPWQHVAYAGGPPAMNDLLGGQICALALPEGLLRQHHLARRVRVLATSGPSRSTYLPDVPSFVESGHPNLLVKEWFAFFAPGRTAPETVLRLSAALADAIERPGVTTVFADAGMTPASSSPQALEARIAVERRGWQTVLRINDIHAD